MLTKILLCMIQIFEEKLEDVATSKSRSCQQGWDVRCVLLNLWPRLKSGIKLTMPSQPSTQEPILHTSAFMACSERTQHIHDICFQSLLPQQCHILTPCITVPHTKLPTTIKSFSIFIILPHPLLILSCKDIQNISY